jgi:hypothetical protein
MLESRLALNGQLRHRNILSASLIGRLGSSTFKPSTTTFQTIHHCGFNVAHGLLLLFGIGTKAVLRATARAMIKLFAIPSRLIRSTRLLPCCATHHHSNDKDTATGMSSCDLHIKIRTLDPMAADFD